MGLHLQLLVGAVGVERKMNSSVGLGLALEPEMETKVELTRFNINVKDITSLKL